MTDAPPSTALTTEPSPQMPVKAPRVYTPVESVQGIMDSARFEHLGRVAQVMARAGLMPQSLTHYKDGTGDNAPMIPHEPEIVVARAYLIANQAELWKADPMAVAQCTSLVHGKLMFEGKLVHAIVSARLGIDLIYQFGQYDAHKRDIMGEFVADPVTGEPVWQGKMPTSADDQSLGVRVIGTLPGETQPRMICGSVAMWHKGAKSPWGSTSAWPRQLRYMGAREWTRAYKPSLLLGIITDDEVEEYAMGRQVGAVAAPAAPALTAEFSDAPSLPPPAKKTRASKAPAPIDPIEPTTVAEPEPKPEPEPVAEEAPASGGDNIFAGPAPAGVLYILSSEEPGEDDRIQAYKDGQPFSRLVATEENLNKVAVYDDHPEVTAEEPATEAAAEEAPAEAEAEEEEGEGPPPEFKAYIDAVEGAPTWADTRKAMQTFYSTDLFKSMSPEQQNHVRANTWDAVLDGAMADKPDQAMDLSACRLWIEWVGDGMTDEETADAIQGTLETLRGSPAWAAAPEATKNAVAGAAEARIAALRG